MPGQSPPSSNQVRPWSRTNQLIVAAAARLGVEAEAISSAHSDFFMRLRWPDAPEGPRAVIISKTRSPYLSQIAQTLSNNKFVGRELLAGLGLPVVSAELFDEGADPRVHPEARARAEAQLRRHGRVVVKPNWGNRGLGVCTKVSEMDQLLAAYAHASAHDRDEEVLVEPHLDGINLRVVVVGGEVCAAAEIHRPVLLGDGQRSARQLLVELNSDPRRGSWERPALVVLDQIVEELVAPRLALLGLTIEQPLPVGLRVELCCDESEVIDRTDQLDPAWAEVARRAADALGVDVAGVDLRGPAHALLSDVSAPDPPDPSGAHAHGALLEINVVPALHLHELPTRGRARPVFEAFVRYCLQLPDAPPIRAKVQL